MNKTINQKVGYLKGCAAYGFYFNKIVVTYLI